MGCGLLTRGGATDVELAEMDTPVKIHQYTNTPPRLSVVEKVPLSDRGDVGTAIDALGIGPYLVCSSVARPLLRRSPSQLTRHSCVSRFPSAPTRLEDMCELAPPWEGFEVGGGQGAATMCPLIAERVGDPQPDSRQLLKLVRMAGLQPWPRIFQMMWVSCETTCSNRSRSALRTGSGTPPPSPWRTSPAYPITFSSGPFEAEQNPVQFGCKRRCAPRRTTPDQNGQIVKKGLECQPILSLSRFWTERVQLIKQWRLESNQHEAL